jgi:hypothetical protein
MIEQGTTTLKTAGYALKTIAAVDVASDIFDNGLNLSNGYDAVGVGISFTVSGMAGAGIGATLVGIKYIAVPSVLYTVDQIKAGYGHFQMNMINASYISPIR